MEDEATELGEDADDTPRQQIFKKRRRYLLLIFLSGVYSKILAYLQNTQSNIKTFLEQVRVIMRHYILLIVNLDL